MNENKRIWDMKSGRGLGTFVVGLAISCTVAAGQQKPSISGIVHKVGGLPVSHAEVRIEGAGASETSDSGEFALPMTATLHVGMAAIFHVTNWIILKPCELKSGRTYLRDPSAEPIELIVLARGDPRLKSAKANVSIIGCLIEEQASDFAPKPKSGGGPRSALPTKHGPLFPMRTEKSYAEAGVKAGPHAPSYHVVEAAYHYSAAFSEQETEKPKDAADAANDEFLARKAKELGFTVEELKSAINQWAKSVEDPYEKGLAALHELRYVEASRYISASIPSPAGAFVDRYVPLARAEYEQAHYRAAELALRKVIAVHRDDPVVLNLLGLVLDRQGRYSEAEPLYRRALAIEETAVGTDAPEVATILNNLAMLYDEQGKHSDAGSLFKRALAIDEKAWGTDAPEIATDLANLATLYDEQGRYSEAESLYKRALAINEKAFGTDHPEVASDLSGLAVTYYRQGKYSEAELLCKRALDIKESTFGRDHPEVAEDIANLATLYDEQGKHSKAEPLYKRALAIDERAFGTDHPAVATDLNNLAVLYYEQGKYRDAEPLYKHALDIDEKVLGTDHPKVGEILTGLAALYVMQRRYGDAEPLSKRALAINEKALGPDHPDVATDLNNLAMLYYQQGRYSEAEPLFKRAVAIDEKALGRDHPTVVGIEKNLALTLRKLGRNSKKKD